jgi:hypothetical protein
MAAPEKPIEKDWKTLTPDEKLQKRLDAWLSPPGIKFETPEAEKAYKERVTNVIDAIRLRKTPRRVPVMTTLGSFAESFCGYTHQDLMYDVDKAIDCMNKCTLEFNIDTVISPGVQSGKVYDTLDFKLYSWPGHGLADDADDVQYIEGQYMGPEEYDAFIRNPTYYWGGTYLPRIMGTLEPLRNLGYPLCGSGATSSIPSSMSAYGLPEVQAALKKMMQAGEDILKWQQKTGAASRRLAGLGYPSMGGGTSKAPFDLIGDSMRGFSGSIMDIYRRPQKLMEAMDALVPILIEMGLKTSRMGAAPIVGFALHKGADGFMSDEQFKTFYWGPLRKIVMALINEGLIPRLGAQGGYNSRLEVIRDVPRGKVIWALGQATDLARAKEIVGGVACISGNIPASLIHSGTPQEVTEHCRKLIEIAGKGGGYLYATAQGVNRNSSIENVRAMIDCGKKYGRY